MAVMERGRRHTPDYRARIRICSKRGELGLAAFATFDLRHAREAGRVCVYLRSCAR